MAALQCEICGGKLMAKSGGLFECEYCGMQYDKTRIQEMVQEIKGTVKVEGTVQVQGTVAVDTQGNKENLLKRIAICAGDGSFGKIKELVDQVLNLDPECGEAYLWRLMATWRVQNIDALFAGPSRELSLIERNADWKKALRFSSLENRQMLERRFAEAKDYWQKSSPELKIQFDRVQPVQHLLFGNFCCVGALKADGTVSVAYNERNTWLGEIASWTDIKKIVVGRWWGYVIGLRWDGTVLLAAQNKEEHQTKLGDILKRTDIKDIADFAGWVVALTESGELISTESGKEDHMFGCTYYQCSASDWSDVASITLVKIVFKGGATITSHIVLGLTSEGKVRCANGPIPKDFMNLDWWKAYENVVKISANGDVLLADGSIYNRPDKSPQPGKWLDFDIDDKGICKFGLPNFGRDVIAHDTHYALRADGSIICSPEHKPYVNIEVEQWKDIVAIRKFNVDLNKAALLGLREDGTVLLSWPEDTEGKFSVDGWKLFESLDSFQAERDVARRKVEEQVRIARQKVEEQVRIARQKQEEEWRIQMQRRNAGQCQHCGGELKGLFSKKCVSCGKRKDY